MTTDAARLFDGMAGSYDELEPWYEHLYRQLDALVRDTLPPVRPGARALDAGCGTGFQAASLRALGWTVHGVDLSTGLLAVARGKRLGAALACGDLEALPYPEASFDAVTCCGSALSFVDDPARALAEIGRVLRPGGRLLLECEHKWSLDLVWAFASAITGDALGYGVTSAGAWRQVARPLREGFRLDYPVALPDGGQAYMRLRLFTMAEIAGMLAAAGLVAQGVWGIHGVTNVVPSTVLHRARLPRSLARVYRVLCALDRALAPTPAWRFANSVVVLAEKVGERRYRERRLQATGQTRRLPAGCTEPSSSM